MSEYTNDEALAFIEAIRLTLADKVGFKWLVERLSGLAAFIETVTAENTRLNAYIDHLNTREDYESYVAAHPFTTEEGGGAS
jgi:hypothetical protein